MNRPPRTPIERALVDAAALVRVASPEDWPAGFVIVNEWLPPNLAAAAIGGGEGLAGVFGWRGGVRAVVIHAARFVANHDCPTDAELANVERAACHEAAHAVLAPDATPDVVRGLLDDAGGAVAGYNPARVADMHGPRWAAAYWLFVMRGAAFRPGRRGDMLRQLCRVDLARYGFDAADVERVTRGADPAVPLRRLLAAGGPAAALLDMTLPDTDTRVAAIVAAGIAREPQPTGVAT
jgi:hypothetical protein